MAKIPQYDRGIVRARPTPRQGDFSAIANAGASFKAVAALTGMGANIARAHEEANEATALNDALVKQKKSVLEINEKARQESINNPFGFARRMDEDLKKVSDQFMQQLPTARAKKQFLETTKQQSVSLFQSNLNWENNASTQLYAKRTEQAAQDINDAAYLAGRNGSDFDSIMADVNATTVSVGTYQPNVEVLRNVKAKMSEGASISYIKGVGQNDPAGAVRLIEDGMLDGSVRPQKLDELRNSYAKKAAKQLAASDPALARDFANSLRGIDDDNMSDINGIIDDQEDLNVVINSSQDLAIGTKALMMASSGEIDIADIVENEDLAPETKDLAIAMINGDPHAVESAQRFIGQGGKGISFDNYEYISAIKRAKAIYESSAQTTKDKKSYMERLNSINTMGGLARLYNEKNPRKGGINKTDYGKITGRLSEINSELYESMNGGVLASVMPTPIDGIHDEISELTEDAFERNRLLSFAVGYAEEANIDVNTRSPVGYTKKMKEIMGAVKDKRRRDLGLPSDAPDVSQAIVGGEKQKLSSEKTNTKPDRAVTAPVKLTRDDIIIEFIDD